MTEKQFTECKYYQYNDNIWSLGYCTNPIRHKKINDVALLCCQGSACELDTKKMNKKKDLEKFVYCYKICPHKDRYNGWCNYHYKDDSEVDYNTCEKNKGGFND